MKTIEKSALKCNKEYSLQPAPAYLGFIQGVKFAQEWIPADEKPDTPYRDEEGISYSDWLLIKVEGFEHPFIGYYVKANDDEFFDKFVSSVHHLLLLRLNALELVFLVRLDLDPLV